MRGEAASNHNVMEIARLHRLERMSRDFYLALSRTICLLLAFSVGFLALKYEMVSTFSRSPSGVGNFEGISMRNTSLSSFIYCTISLLGYFWKGIATLLVIIMLWCIAGLVGWMVTPKYSSLSESQLRKLGAATIRSFSVASAPIASKDSSKDGANAASAALKTGLGAAEKTTPSQAPPATSSLLQQQWYSSSSSSSSAAAMSTAASAPSTPQWQQYHTSPVNASRDVTTTASFSFIDELSGVGRTFDAFTALEISPLSLTDDCKDSFKRLLIRFLQDTINRFDAVAEGLVGALVAANKLNAADKPLALSLAKLDNPGDARLKELLNLCKDAFVTNTYNRSPQNISLLAEYLSLLSIFDVKAAGSASTGPLPNVDALKPKEVRAFAKDPRHYDRSVVT